MLERVPAVRRRMIAAWAVALVLGVSAFRLAGYCASTLPRRSPLEELSYYPSGKALRPATLGHAETAADLAWIRAVQYYGEHRHSDNEFTRMDHVFDILTALSPQFESAYVFGAFAMAQEGLSVERGERLMLSGLERNPTSGRLAFEMGFFYFVRAGGRDLRKAGEYFERASHLPGAPSSAGRFAAYTRQNAGDLAVAYQLWSNARDTSPNQYLREMAEREMAKIREAIDTGRHELAIHRLTTPIVLIR